MLVIEPGFRRTSALVWSALAVTTLVNTTLPLLGIDAEVRDCILIAHAALGLAASWCIALALAAHAAGAAGAGLVFALIEKGAELAGQILLVFTVHRGWRVELASAADPAVRAALEAKLALFGDLWNDAFLVFWIAAVLSNLWWWRAARGRGLRAAFAVMTGLALALVVQDYGKQAWIGTFLPYAYPCLLTASRVYIAWWLWRGEAPKTRRSRVVQAPP